MFVRRWLIRQKLLAGWFLLVAICIALTVNGVRGMYAYRGLARTISHRATELQLATALSSHVSDLRVTLSHARRLHDFPVEGARTQVNRQLLREQFRAEYQAIGETVRRYRERLANPDNGATDIADNRAERETIQRVQHALDNITELNRDEDWMLDEVKVELLGEDLEQLHTLAHELPGYLQQRMHDFAGGVRTQYRTWIIFGYVSLAFSLLLLGGLMYFVWHQLLCPFRVLIRGARQVANDDFDHRIHLDTEDEMAELAAHMNAMTERFQQIHTDLERQVKQRTMDLVRSEQLASVGVLAAGVAHEINNPLASIAICAEALESRLQDILKQDDLLPDEDRCAEIGVLRNYLRMIQDEAFRSKEITDRLLDFSRRGDAEKHPTNLGELVQSVIEMVQHLGKYRGKEIHFDPPPLLLAPVAGQEMKQVVLNLLTNALEAVDAGGNVQVELRRRPQHVEMIVTDDGCGMTDEVMSHLYEPFFTSRETGQGTGLGLAITYRIVTDHDGRIDAESHGPGRGSTFRVTLPLEQHEEKRTRKQQAA